PRPIARRRCAQVPGARTEGFRLLAEQLPLLGAGGGDAGVLAGGVDDRLALAVGRLEVAIERLDERLHACLGDARRRLAPAGLDERRLGQRRGDRRLDGGGELAEQALPDIGMALLVAAHLAVEAALGRELA